jgi:hypothetical protein
MAEESKASGEGVSEQDESRKEGDDGAAGEQETEESAVVAAISDKLDQVIATRKGDINGFEYEAKQPEVDGEQFAGYVRAGTTAARSRVDGRRFKPGKAFG